MVFSVLSVLATATLALAAPAATAPPADGRHALIQLTPRAACTEAAELRAAGAIAIAPELRLYRLPSTIAGRLTPGLRARGAVQTLQPDRPVGRLSASQFTDPFALEDWWRSAIGIDGLEPPGPGKPVTVVDSGIDVTHPEFLNRPGTELLNSQEPLGIGGEHGTAVASLIGATANGVGIVGIYPQAVLRSWDAALGAGTQLDTSEIVAGLVAAARNGAGVINLSLGSQTRESLIEQAVDSAYAHGSLVVAASGNEGEGSALGYPAALPHVLTVAATDPSNQVASFSSPSRFVDLAAPGSGMTVASAIQKGYRQAASGTSFAAPLVSGAAAWVWTARPELDNGQLFEVMRRSAVDIGAPGRDQQSGFGLLNVRNALGFPAPIRDPLEPNEDVEYVKPGGFFGAEQPITQRGRRENTTFTARLDSIEDRSDVYRLWLPARKTVTVTLRSSVDLDLALWGPSAISISQQPGTARLAVSARRGTGSERIVLKPGSGRYGYVAVTIGRSVAEASYRLTVKTT